MSKILRLVSDILVIGLALAAGVFALMYLVYINGLFLAENNNGTLDGINPVKSLASNYADLDGFKVAFEPKEILKLDGFGDLVGANFKNVAALSWLVLALGAVTTLSGLGSVIFFWRGKGFKWTIVTGILLILTVIAFVIMVVKQPEGHKLFGGDVPDLIKKLVKN